MDEETRLALQDFKSRLEARFGERLKGVYLFGSRARGDHRPDSDADVAVVLDERIESGMMFLEELVHEAYGVFLERDLYIQPWALQYGSLENPDRFWGAKLARTVIRDGVRLT